MLICFCLNVINNFSVLILLSFNYFSLYIRTAFDILRQQKTLLKKHTTTFERETGNKFKHCEIHIKQIRKQ